MVLFESLEADRAPRVPVRLEDLPERLWRAVLAAEDHRFFEHAGVDGKAIARALLKNIGRGEIAQGGSTITQQLVKNRDLSPKRSLNVPFVRVAEHCGFDEMADRVRQAGLSLPSSPPLSFVLGSIETSPLALARAYTAFASPGAVLEPRRVLRVSAPGGRGLHRHGVEARRVTRKPAA